MLLQRNINAFSISLTDRGLRMDGDGVGNRTKPSSVSVNDFYQELRNYRILLFLSRITELQNSIIFIKNYRITEFIFYQKLRNYRILLFLSRITELQNFYYFYQELRNYRILLSECGPSDGFFFNSLILDKRKRMCDKDFIET